MGNRLSASDTIPSWPTKDWKGSQLSNFRSQNRDTEVFVFRQQLKFALIVADFLASHGFTVKFKHSCTDGEHSGKIFQQSFEKAVKTDLSESGKYYVWHKVEKFSFQVISTYNTTDIKPIVMLSVEENGTEYCRKRREDRQPD
jgi:hypothetical protein